MALNAPDYRTPGPDSDPELWTHFENLAEDVAQDAVELDTQLQDIAPRVPAVVSAPGFLAVVLDALGRQSWLGARSSDGGPTEWAVAMLRDRLGLLSQTVPGYLFAVTDSEKRLTDLSIRSSDGQFAQFVIDRLKARILDGSTPATGSPASGSRQYADAPWALDAEVFPVRTDTSRAVVWGSSSAEEIADHFGALFRGLGAAFWGGGKGGERAEHIAARLGSVPALLTATGGTIPASGPVAVTSSNMSLSAFLRPYPGTWGGVPGTLAHQATGNTYQFTRTTAGDPVPVPADTPFIPDQRSYRDAVTLLWMGKNNQSEADAVEKVVRLTDASFNWLAPLHKRALVLGHFVDTNTPAGSELRTRVQAINANHARRYGRLFLDVSGYLTSAKVWTDLAMTPTPEDLAQQSLGNKPPSLSRDNGHLNELGKTAVTTHLLQPRIASLGWY